MTLPVLIPGKGASLPDLVQTLQKFSAQIRTIPPVAIRGHSTESRDGYHALWVSPVHILEVGASDAEMVKFSYRLLSTVNIAFNHALGHASDIKRGALPVISFYRIGPHNTERRNLEQEFGSRFPLYIKEFPREMQKSVWASTLNAFPMYCLKPGDTHIGELVFKDPILSTKVSTSEGESPEQQLFHWSKNELSAYYEVLRMLLMLAQCNWEA